MSNLTPLLPPCSVISLVLLYSHARTARIIIPDYPHHIIQRGHNRQAVFAGDDDYQYYLDNLAEWKQVFACKVYAFCLMTNHVHLVVDPVLILIVSAN